MGGVNHLAHVTGFAHQRGGADQGLGHLDHGRDGVRLRVAILAGNKLGNYLA